MLRGINGIDLLILNELLKNPRESFLTISKKVGIAPITVQKRYEKMLNIVFAKSFIIIDLSKIGFGGKAYLMINSTGSDPKLTLEVLHQIPNVFLIAETIGKFELIALVAFRDINDLKKVVNKIRDQPSVKKVHVALTEQTDFPVKRDYGSELLLDTKADSS